MLQLQRTAYNRLCNIKTKRRSLYVECIDYKISYDSIRLPEKIVQLYIIINTWKMMVYLQIKKQVIETQDTYLITGLRYLKILNLINMQIFALKHRSTTLLALNHLHYMDEIICTLIQKQKQNLAQINVTHYMLKKEREIPFTIY